MTTVPHDPNSMQKPEFIPIDTLISALKTYKDIGANPTISTQDLAAFVKAVNIYSALHAALNDSELHMCNAVFGMQCNPVVEEPEEFPF